jgi:hypothetical protein
MSAYVGGIAARRWHGIVNVSKTNETLETEF